MGLSMPKVMLKVVSMVLQHIIMLVLYLPPHPPVAGYLFRVSLIYLFVRYPTVVIRPFSRLLCSFPDNLLKHIPQTLQGLTLGTVSKDIQKREK
jgi:hypothetical protein